MTALLEPAVSRELLVRLRGEAGADEVLRSEWRDGELVLHLADCSVNYGRAPLVTAENAARIAFRILARWTGPVAMKSSP